MRGLFFFPYALLSLFIFILGLFLLFFFVKIGLIALAFSKLGLSGWQVFWLLVLTFLGSGINIPLVRRRIKVLNLDNEFRFNDPFFRHIRPYPLDVWEGGEQVIALNVGGALIPILLSLYFISQIGVSLSLGFCFLIVTLVCFKLARPIPGIGLGIPFLIPPLVTALVTWTLAPKEIAPQVAYISGTLGTLLGADVLHLLKLDEQDKILSPVISIGGAGTFDGIFLCGVIAVLLA